MDNKPLRAVLRYVEDLCARDGVQPPDHDLLADLVGRRDERAFAALMRRHGPMVLGVCRRVLHNEYDAEDAFQATFLVLAKKADTVRRGESLHAWLYRVAYRLARRLRAQAAARWAAAMPKDVPGPRSDPDNASWREICAALDEELELLPEKYRTPLVLCCLSGKTRDEAAEELGWSLNVLKGRLERGRKLLQARLQRRGVELSAVLLALTVVQGAGAAVPTTLAAATLRVGSVALGAAGAVSPQVLRLAEFGIRASGVARLKAAVLSAILGGVVLGAAVAGTAALTDPPTGPSAATDARPSDHPATTADRPRIPFRDVTRESGLEAILDAKYDATPTWFLSGLHLVDLDGDGHLDFFMSAPGLRRSGAVAALNDGTGRFRLAAGTHPPTELRLAHDIDEDGRVDLCFTYQDGGGQWWRNKSRPGVLEFEPTEIRREANTARRQAVIDLDRDGKADWLRGVPDFLAFDLADGKGGFAADAGRLPVADTDTAETLCLPADLDGDGHIDLVVEWGHFGNAQGTSRIYRNDGRMRFTDVTKQCGLGTGDLAVKGVGDVNRDGFPDLFVLEDSKPEIYLNDGKGRFTKLPGAVAGMEAATKPDAASWGLAVMTDLDNDGIPDLLWNGKHFLWVLRGTGGGRFEYANTAWGIKDLSVSSVDDGLCFGDIDGDGRLDVIGYTVAEGRHRFAVYLNTQPRDNGWLRVRPVGRPGNRGATGAKIRVTDPRTGKLLWYEQVAIFSSQSAQSYYSLGDTERHIGLGQLPAVDVRVEFYPSGTTVERKGIAARSTVTVREDAAR